MVRAHVTGVDVASHGSEYPCNPHTRLASCPRRHIPHGGRRWLAYSWTNMAEHAQLQILIPSRDVESNHVHKNCPLNNEFPRTRASLSSRNFIAAKCFDPSRIRSLLQSSKRPVFLGRLSRAGDHS